jgi:uncharacterized protein YodC (DUF2158 family)
LNVSNFGVIVNQNNMALEKTITKEWNQFEDFNVGDQVRVRSGGPLMTIDGTSGSRYVCVWFANAEFHRDNFDQATLEKVAAKDPDLSPA